MFKNLKEPFQTSEESETGVFILAGIHMKTEGFNLKDFFIALAKEKA